MRLFLAINLPDEEKARLHESAAGLRDAGLPVRWADREALHLTLRFLGEVAEPRVAAIESVMGAVGAAYSPVWLDLRGVGAFPSLARPRVLWLGIEAAPELLSLQRDLERGLETIGFEPEPRPFHPHVTLGRARRYARDRDFRDLTRLVGSVRYEARVTARSVDLMRSHLGAEGARHERIAKAPLTVLERQ